MKKKSSNVKLSAKKTKKIKRKAAKPKKKLTSKKLQPDDIWGEIKMVTASDLNFDLDAYALYSTVTGTCPSRCSGAHISGTRNVSCC